VNAANAAVNPRRVTTVEILARRALELTCGQECVDWAVGLLVEGQDSVHLRELAGALEPLYHFEVAALRDAALDELHIEPVSPADAVTMYARERLRAALAGNANLIDAIYFVSQLYIAHDDARALLDFYLLDNAYADLRFQGEQWYWNGADRSNILEIMRQRAEEFVAEALPARD
jgi:hypothetical protein